MAYDPYAALPKKPIIPTLVTVALCALLTPVLGVDAIADTAGAGYLCYRWWKYHREATRGGYLNAEYWLTYAKAAAAAFVSQMEARDAAGDDAPHEDEARRQERESDDRHSGHMSRKEALDYLDLAEPFTLAELTRAHHEFLKRNHPDAGGSTYVMQLANIARDVLMEDLRG
jgi:hypothetical protein